MRAKEFLAESRLSDLADIRTNFPDADFWLVRRGSEAKIGQPTREFSPEHIGVKVTALDRLDSNYLYYAMQYLHSKGTWKQLAYGTLNLKNIRADDVRRLAIG